MGIKIDWNALLAPLITQLIKILVERILEWAQEQSAKVAVGVAAETASWLAKLDGSKDQLKTAADMANWAKKTMA